MNVPAKLGVYVGALVVVFAAAFALGDVTGTNDSPSERHHPSMTTDPASSRDHTGEGS